MLLPCQGTGLIGDKPKAIAMRTLGDAIASSRRRSRRQ